VARIVFIVESEDHGLPSDGHWLTGRFERYLEGAARVLDRFEDLPLEEALAWARERADRVFIRHGDQPDSYYSAGRDRRLGVPRWPPRDLPELVRCRHPDERWLDRTTPTRRSRGA
jgi:hypothetical protein